VGVRHGPVLGIARSNDSSSRPARGQRIPPAPRDRGMLRLRSDRLNPYD